MKLDKTNKTYIIAAIVALLLIVLVVVFVISRATLPGDPDEIVIQKENGTLVVNRNGQVTYTFGDSAYVDQWNQDKTNTFFDYIYNKYSNSDSLAEEGFPDTVTFTLNGEQKTVAVSTDELVDVVVNDTVNSGGGDSGGGGATGGEAVGDYFATATPVATPASTFGPTPTPYSGTDPHPGCLYWKLSYCAVARPSAPPATPAPSGQYVIDASDCADWNSQVGNNTIINNTVCIPDQ